MPAAEEIVHKVEIHPTREDYMSFIISARDRMAKDSAAVRKWMCAAGWLAIIIAWPTSSFLRNWEDMPGWLPDWLTSYLFLPLSISIYLLLKALIRLVGRSGNAAPSVDEAPPEPPKSVELAPDGFRLKTEYTSSDNDWRTVSRIVDRAGLIVFFLDRTLGIIIPRDSFDSAVAANEFLSAARGYHEAAKQEPAQVKRVKGKC